MEQMRLIDADEFFRNYPELAIEPYINAPTVEQKHYERIVAQINPVIEARPQTIDCTNCKHESKRLIDEPCKYCNIKYSEWEAKDETN